MDRSQLNWITNFIWGMADDVLRDVYVRGKYQDVILPVTVIRPLEAVLDGRAEKASLDMKAKLDAAGIANQDRALRQAGGHFFYHAPPFALRERTNVQRRSSSEFVILEMRSRHVGCSGSWFL
jgi:type I restriction enzyme M protein